MAWMNTMLAWVNPGMVSFLGAALVAVGAFWGFRVQAAKSDQLARLAQENAALSRQPAAKSDEIAGLAKDSLAAVTGGESFVYLEPLRKGGRVRYFVRHTGDHPAYDVVVRVQEVLQLPDGKRTRKLLFGPADVGRTLARGSGLDWTYPDPTSSDPREWPLVFPEPPPPGAGPREFRIELDARNGIVVQRFRLWPVGDRWHTESRLIGRRGAEEPKLPAGYQEAQAQPANPPETYDDGR